MARIKLNSRGFSEVLNSAGVRALVTEHAAPVLATAKASAPVDEGEYVVGLHIEQATTDRAVARVVASAPHSLIVEANTGNLVRALDAAGGS